MSTRTTVCVMRSAMNTRLPRPLPNTKEYLRLKPDDAEAQNKLLNAEKQIEARHRGSVAMLAAICSSSVG
ncbi:MAG: hypothetical protein JO189_31690 [Deltaproteobacteria bacterium]|nr:hypothetical protein [Deltaproteobacteria bacterium]